METMRGLMKTQQEVMTSTIEIAGQGNQPWYAGAIEEGLNKVRMIGAAMAERNAPQPAQQQQMQQMQAQQQAQARARLQQRRHSSSCRLLLSAPTPLRLLLQRADASPHASPASPTPGLEGRAQHTGGRPEGTTYNRKPIFILRMAARWRTKSCRSTAGSGARDVAARRGRTKAPGWRRPTRCGSGPARQRQREEAARPPCRGGTSSRGTPARGAPASSRASPPPANGQGYTLAELRELDPDQIRMVVNPLEDIVLFGAFLQAIADLSARVAKGMPTEEAPSEWVNGL